jgi:large subunit ribosomal protein L21
MVAVAQLVESRIVIPVVVGSSPISHPIILENSIQVISQSNIGVHMTYAVIKTGGKQYRVSVGDKLKIEQIAADVDSEISLKEILMVGEGDQITVGSPFIQGASVSAKIISHGRGEKIRIFKMRRRKHYQKHQGHRQNYTEILIQAVNS